MTSIDLVGYPERPPGIDDDVVPPGLETQIGVPVPAEEELEDPGTPLENETHDEIPIDGDVKPMGDVDEDEDADEDDDDDDDEDGVQIVIGELKSNVTFQRPQGGRAGAVGAKQTSKLDIDATGTVNGNSIFDTDINALEDKPWRKPGADITDYFNYGFTEDTWKIYCERQNKLRTEFGSGVQANKAYFSTPVYGMQPGMPASVHSSSGMPVPTLEKGKVVPQIINLANPQSQAILRTISMVPTNVVQPPKMPMVMTQPVPTPNEVPQTNYSSAEHETPPSSPGTPAAAGSGREDATPPPGVTGLKSTPTSSSDLSKMTTMPPTSANLVPNLSVPPPRLLPPTNLPPPGFGPPPGVFATLLPPTNVPPPGLPPGFGNPPPPGLPPHHYVPSPYGFPPPVRPQVPPPRYGPPPGAYGVYDNQSSNSRNEAHSPASYSDKSSDDDDRGDGYEHRYPGGSSRSRGEYGRRSRSPYSSAAGGRHRYSHSRPSGSGGRGHRSRSPVERDSADKERGSSKRRSRPDDDELAKKKKRHRDDSASAEKKKSSKDKRDDESSRSSSKRRKRSRERKTEDEKSRH